MFSDRTMNKLLLGIILVASLAFLAFLVTVIAISIMNRQEGQSLVEASRATIISGWKGVKEGLGGKSTSPSKSGYDFPHQPPFTEMRQPSTEAKYYHVGKTAPSANAIMSSYNRPRGPVVFPGAAFTPTPSSDLNAPAVGAYESFATDALSEDIDAMSGRHLFGERPLPAPPVTDDQFRYTGDFEIKRGDPLLSSPMTKTHIGFSNRGVGLWSCTSQGYDQCYN